MEKNIYFYSDSVRISGTLKIPEITGGKSLFPAVVLSHGYGASREEFGDFLFLSDFLNSLGIAVLIFDYRGCGKTAYPLGRMLCSSHWQQDLKNAVSFLGCCSSIDNKRICIIGESMGAATAILAAADDSRVKCVIAMSPIADGYEWIKQNWTENKGIEEFHNFLQEVEEDKKRETVYGQSNLVKMSEAMAYKQKYLDLIEDIHKSFDDYSFTYFVQLASISSILEMKPAEHIKKIAPRPVFIMAGKKDGIVPWELNAQKLYDNAGKLKKITVFDEGDHGLLAEPVKENAIAEISGWLKKYL